MPKNNLLQYLGWEAPGYLGACSFYEYSERISCICNLCKNVIPFSIFFFFCSMFFKRFSKGLPYEVIFLPQRFKKNKNKKIQKPRIFGFLKISVNPWIFLQTHVEQDIWILKFLKTEYPPKEQTLGLLLFCDDFVPSARRLCWGAIPHSSNFC